MNLSKIRSAARSQQPLHVFGAYFAPTLRISLVINSRQPYALSRLSLTTDCNLATQVRQHTGVLRVVISNKNVQGIFKKFPHFYIFAGNGEGGSSSN
jgi:hypothetical protein